MAGSCSLTFVIPLKKGIQEKPLANSRAPLLDSLFRGNDSRAAGRINLEKIVIPVGVKLFKGTNFNQGITQADRLKTTRLLGVHQLFAFGSLLLAT